MKEREKLYQIHVQDYYRMKTQWETISKEQEERFSDFKERKSLIGEKTEHGKVHNFIFVFRKRRLSH